MKAEPQTADELIQNLSRLNVEWRDESSDAAIRNLAQFPVKDSYGSDDIRQLLNGDFENAKLIIRLFLDMSKDTFESTLVGGLGRGNAGITYYRKSPDDYVNFLLSLGVAEAMFDETHRELAWSDVLVERLKSGRGSAISGQKRGRLVEDFVEEIVKRVFGDQYKCRSSDLIGQLT